MKKTLFDSCGGTVQLQRTLFYKCCKFYCNLSYKKKIWSLPNCVLKKLREFTCKEILKNCAFHVCLCKNLGEHEKFMRKWSKRQLSCN